MYLRHQTNKIIIVFSRNGTGKTVFLQSSTDAMDNHMGKDYLFDRRKDREPEPMSDVERVKFDFFTKKETTSFRPMIEKKSVPHWFAMRKFSEGGSTSTRILGEALPNLDQDN